MSNIVGKAIFTTYSNDIYWTIYLKDTGRLTWTGYNDTYWWDNISTKVDFTEKHAKDGKTYTLDTKTCVVTSRPTLST
jgi:hypothetical protein